MKAGRQELVDVLRVERIAAVHRHVRMQVIRVRIDQTAAQTGERTQNVVSALRQPGHGRQGSYSPAEYHRQQLAPAVRSDHDDPTKKPP